MKQFYLHSAMLLLCMIIGLNAWGNSWKRCTAVSDLTAGGTFIIGYEATANSGVIVPMQNSSNATTSVPDYLYSGTNSDMSGSGTIDMQSVTETSLYEVTIAASTVVDGAITIKCGDNFIGNTNTKNNLKFFTTEAATTAFTPTVGENDVFTLKIAANATYHTLQFNSNSAYARYAVYGGKQKNVVIYKKTESQQTTTTTATAPSLTQVTSFTSSMDVTITNNESDGTVYYTTDGNNPTTSSENFTEKSKVITISATTTIKAMTVVEGKENSSVVSATYIKKESTPEASDAVSLPFTFDNGKSAIANTVGMSQSGLGSDYSSAPKLKFDTTGDELIIKYNGDAKYLRYDIKGYSFSGGTFDVMESADGTEYTSVEQYSKTFVYGTKVVELNSDSRYVKFVYTEKSLGNVALGGISIFNDISRTTAKGYLGTICSKYAITSTGAKIYSAAMNETDDGVDLTEVTETVAGVPYIYQAVTDSPTFILDVNATEATAPVAGSILTGVFTDTYVPAGSYVMQTQNSVQQFYMVESANTVCLSANKAYLTVPDSNAKSLGIGFTDNEGTAIKAVNAIVEGTAKIYDINGRRLSTLQKGINIVNGVKILMK